MSPQQPLPPKKEVALALLERSSVHLHLDPRLDGVVVPPWLKKQVPLVLLVGLNMPVPIPDLRLDDEGMSCTLSFNRSPFFCIVPWASVFAIVGEDGRGMVWPDDVPPEVAQAPARARGPEAVEDSAARKAPTKRPQLEEVRSVRSDDARPTKAKRPRKKPQIQPAPPVLASSGPPEPRAGAGGASASRGGRDRIAPVSADGSDGARSPFRQQPQAARKPKRELPPYLRVVK